MSRTATTFILAAIAALTAYDLWSDYGEGAAWLHLATEGVVLTLSGAGVFYLLARHRCDSLAVSRLVHELEETRRDLDLWRKEARRHLQGLGVAIDAQFDRWSLTPAEKEVGLLLLKGLSSKEIALVRSTSERTVRQQAQSVYEKASVSGRAEFAAFFLEDLLLPASSSPRA